MDKPLKDELAEKLTPMKTDLADANQARLRSRGLGRQHA
jgi:hypothetical protein